MINSKRAPSHLSQTYHIIRQYTIDLILVQRQHPLEAVDLVGLQLTALAQTLRLSLKAKTDSSGCTEPSGLSSLLNVYLLDLLPTRTTTAIPALIQPLHPLGFLVLNVEIH